MLPSRQMELVRAHPPMAGGTGIVDTFELEDPDYLRRQLITYIGNKRALLGPISKAVETVKKRLNKTKLRAFDVFSGSGVVSRFLKAHASYLVSNDVEDYATAISRCYLRNRTTLDFTALGQIVADLNARVEVEPLPKGFIQELYSPQDERAITSDDRVLYTSRNARRLDNYRRMIEETPSDLRAALLAPLLHRASVHANNGGVFKGFYKNKHTGVGQYGGTSSDALARIRGFDSSRASGSEQVRVRLFGLPRRRQPRGKAHQRHRRGLHRPAVQPTSVRLQLLHAESPRPLRETNQDQSRLGNTG